MTRALVAGTLLAADADDRRLRYLLLPYGERGRTNLGGLVASAGRLTIPDRITANLEHDDTRPVAYADRADIVETDNGLEATFSVLPTSAGDDLLVEARAGLRAGVSVEVNPIVIRGGRLVSGQLNGAGFVTKPAFPSAGLVAADAGELPEEETAETTSESVVVVDGVEYIRRTTTTEHTETTPAAGEDTNTEEEATVADNTETTTAGASAPAGGLAARRGNTGPAKTTARELYARLADAHRGGGSSGLLAALADIVPGNILGIEQPAYIGELWDGRAYERRVIPLFNHADLTSYEVRGWRWVTKPAVAPYTGNKTAVPSNTVSTEAVSINAERLAGAHDIDRKFKDFNDQEFYAAYFRAMTESYAEQSDAEVLTDVLAAAPAVTPGTVPADVPTGLVYIVDGALAVLNATRTSPTFALVATDLWRDVLLTPKDKTLEYLSASMGLESGSTAGFRIVPAPELAPGQVLVGAKSAVTVHELGSVPIRVEAENIPNGGQDHGVFGYYATNVHDAAGLALVAAAPAG